MYKLFLSLRYLRHGGLAIIASLAVALCVAMVLIVVSVMDGFVRKVEVASKGLGGDIIIEANSLSGIGRYDEFIARLTGRYRVDSQYALAHREPKAGGVEVVFEGPGQPAYAEELAGGLTLDKPLAVAAEGLVYRNGRLVEKVAGTLTLTAVAEAAASNPATPAAAAEAQATPKLAYHLRFQANLSAQAAGPDKGDEPLVLLTVYAKRGDGMKEIAAASPVIESMGLLRIKPTYTMMVKIWGVRLPERLAVTDFAGGLFVQKNWPDATFNPPLEAMLDRSRLAQAEYQRIYAREQERAARGGDGDILPRIDVAIDNVGFQSRDLERTDPAKMPRDHMMLGVGIGGLSFRTSEGETVRQVTPGRQTVLTLLPIGRGKGSLNLSPNVHTFEVVDDVRTDVSIIDDQAVYVPFDTLQLLANLGEQRDMDDPTLVDPARCSNINIKAAPGYDTGQHLVETRQKVEHAWYAFLADHPDATEPGTTIFVQTWGEKMAKYIGAIEKQRTLTIVMFGIISLVSVLLIFAIFYMIVAQKIRDIGIIRAVGGSSAGVAQIFLAFGAATGVVGSAIGLTGGWLFVTYINEIQDWLANWLGFRVWDRDIFLFDKIPSHVDPAVALVIALWAISSGLIGALVPGVRAAVMEPVEAIRYE